MLKQFDTEIGYQTRFEKTKTGGTRLLFLTEGVLLRQMISDPELSQYNAVILDEVSFFFKFEIYNLLII
jgi:HrpA-like RNA helicase